MGQDQMLSQPHDRNGFNPGDELEKHTVYSSGVAHNGGCSVADMKQGFKDTTDERTGVFEPDQYGGTTSAGDPLKAGGFLSRPRGWAR